MTIRVSPARVGRLLALVVCALTLAGLASVTAALSSRSAFGLVRQFDLDGENNIPAWYSASALLVAAGLLAAVARVERDRGAPFARHWTGLAVIFLGLSADEAASLHEMAVRPLRAALGVGGPLFFAWVIPAGALVVLMAVLYAKFLWHLPPRTRLLFAVAGGLYVGGALGMELVGGWLVSTYGWGVAHDLEAVVEEALEMSGVVVFIYALLGHLAQRAGRISIDFDPPPGR